jgi:3'-5' exoribonuclease
MSRLPRIADLDASSTGTGYFLCARKERRTGRGGGSYLAVVLQDVSGEIGARVFQDVDQYDPQFDAGEFVAVQGRSQWFHDRLELVLERIRRVIPDDASRGFREEDCIPSAPRPLDEMWDELQAQIASVSHALLRDVLSDVASRHADRLRLWPAAVQVHHAYRGGLLEHVLQIMRVGSFLAEQYGADRDRVIAGALLHDLGKLEELDYDIAIRYTKAGNLVGHITLGVAMFREAVRARPDFPTDLQTELEHLILSHHGSRDRGSPVVPMTVEAFILAAADELDARLHQVRRHVADDDTAGPFTAYNKRLDRVLLKPSRS